jgi:3-oxoacyl-[acyl-carrier protein] reductase
MTSAPGLDMNNSDLAEKVVVITGGSRGIGLAAAKSLGALGATVVLVGRNPDNLNAAISALLDQGVDADSICVDVSDGQKS